MRDFGIPASDLLDWVRWRFNLSSDRALASLLNVHSPTLSRVRRGFLPLGANLMVRVLDITGVHLRDLPALVKDTARHWRQTCRH